MLRKFLPLIKKDDSPTKTNKSFDDKLSGSSSIVYDFCGAQTLSNVAIVDKNTHLKVKNYLNTLDENDTRPSLMKKGASISEEERNAYKAEKKKFRSENVRDYWVGIPVATFIGSALMILGGIGWADKGDADNGNNWTRSGTESDAKLLAGLCFGLGSLVCIGTAWAIYKYKKLNIDFNLINDYQKKEKIIAKSNRQSLETYQNFPQLGLFNPNKDTKTIPLQSDSKSYNPTEEVEVVIDDEKENSLKKPLLYRSQS